MWYEREVHVRSWLQIAWLPPRYLSERLADGGAGWRLEGLEIVRVGLCKVYDVARILLRLPGRACLSGACRPSGR